MRSWAALATAGRSVLFSGVTVAVSLAALIALPVPFLRSVGFTGLLIPVVSVLAALSLLPALILFLAFISLSEVPTTEVKILATALALGIIIGATIVRGVLAPALVPRSATRTGGIPGGDGPGIEEARRASADGPAVSSVR